MAEVGVVGAVGDVEEGDKESFLHKAWERAAFWVYH